MSARVTIGVPTFNRAGPLRRAVESALAQTWDDLEVVISDNASTDATAEVCRELAGRDARVRHIRQPANLGLTANFNAVAGAASGELVMVLADDDWLDPGYVADCVAALDAESELVVAAGSARYFRDGQLESVGALVNLLDDDPARRVRRYFAEVRDNVTVYGLARRAALERALPLENRLAGDWLLCGRLAMLGRIRTLSETWLNRSAEGTSSSYARTVASMGLTPREARHPHLAIAGFVYADVAREAALYDGLGALRRRLLAASCAYGVLRARPLNVVEDAVRPLLRRPRWRSIDRAVRPLARRLQR